MAGVLSASPSAERIEELWVVCGLYTVVWPADLHQKEAFRQLSDTFFYVKVDKDISLPLANK